MDAMAVPFSAAALALDAEAEASRIAMLMREQVLHRLRRRGVVLGLSGGVDSSVTAALAVRALGPKRVFAVLMPEGESEPESLVLGRRMAEHLGIAHVVEDIGPALTALGCYARRDALIRHVVPGFGPGWGCKVVLDPALRAQGYNLSALVVRDPEGREARHRLPHEIYLGIVAAANMKQRTRKLIEYHHADRLHHAVAGTPNRLEYDQGFFVKGGDGLADLKPIAHLYKTQVYALAAALDVPPEIRARPPTTDTWSLPQTQEEFYFALPWATMDLCLLALDRGVPAEETARATGLGVAAIEAAWRDIAAKRRVAAYLNSPPLLAAPEAA
jgi:NAD+ synthase